MTTGSPPPLLSTLKEVTVHTSTKSAPSIPLPLANDSPMLNVPEGRIARAASPDSKSRAAWNALSPRTATGISINMSSMQPSKTPAAGLPASRAVPPTRLANVVPRQDVQTQLAAGGGAGGGDADEDRGHKTDTSYFAALIRYSNTKKLNWLCRPRLCLTRDTHKQGTACSMFLCCLCSDISIVVESVHSA